MSMPIARRDSAGRISGTSSGSSGVLSASAWMSSGTGFLQSLLGFCDGGLQLALQLSPHSTNVV